MFSTSTLARCFAGFLPFISLAVIGCGQSAQTFPLAKVTGKVTLQGKPVSVGNITLIPIGKSGSNSSGRPATCVIRPDGSFIASTYKEGDGATIGKMMVIFNPPPAPEAASVPEGGHAEPIPNPFAGLSVGVEEIEIKAGDNAVTVELIRK